jgi:hypothetical protein
MVWTQDTTTFFVNVAMAVLSLVEFALGLERDTQIASYYHDEEVRYSAEGVLQHIDVAILRLNSA